jgi:LysR family cys regulon transcriptional activator
MLEVTLKLKLFDRKGKRIVKLTQAGEEVLEHARRVLGALDNIQIVSSDYTGSIGGTLTLATTHTQARYVLPQAIGPFLKRFPNVRLQLKQGNPVQCANWVASGEADLAIATEALAEHHDLATLPSYTWNRVVIAPKTHALAKVHKLDLKTLAAYPIITYDGTFTGRSAIDAAFKQAALVPNVVLTALDSDVIKTYVRLGLGVGIVAEMAVDQKQDDDFVVLPVGHIFPAATTRIGLRRGASLRLTVYEFIGHFAPKITKKMVQTALQAKKN